ncbi:DNA phosphorothioation-associated protein 4 [Trinickia mobilis]|uniref:DNA phosphorothioation-associated protein 4 n=1 Tax=Trinickia mobilis TaxID=2816356 RepID=UPI001A8C5275|nr:DNA phosphorothioation-associated protein 4 [Trinickia mobilis]
MSLNIQQFERSIVAERRIRYAKEKQELMRRLLSSEDGTGPFRTQADVLAFAASLGAHRKRREPLPEALGEPIRQEVFDRQGYDTLICLVAVEAEKSPAVLEDSEEMIARRSEIFEEYANGGLAIIANETRGDVNLSQAVLLMISSLRKRAESDTQVLDLSRLRI